MKRLTMLLTSLFVGFLAIALFSTSHAAAAPPENGYIVVFNEGFRAREVASDVAQQHGLSITHRYEHAIQGMAVRNVPQGRLNALENDPRVAFVETDDIVTIDAQTIPTGIDRIFATGNSNLDIDGIDDYRVDVDVAVIDTGVDYEHPDLNVVGGVNCASFSGCTTGGDDDHYHGTHVAGTIGALDNGEGVVGVAPGARIWAVKVLNSQGSGYESWIVAGIDWVAANASTIEVANMSLGGSGYSQAEYNAIQAAVNNGVAFAVAAGNSAADANNFSPAAFDNVLTVSALADFNGQPGGGAASTCRSDQDDTLASFSNYGSAVDIAAPGVCILSTYPLEQGSYASISGTSMASPHAAGALALLASTNNPNNASDVYALYNTVINDGNYNYTDDSGDGIKEPLLDVTGYTANLASTGGGGGDPTPEPTPEPTPDPSPTITLSVEGRVSGSWWSTRYYNDLSWSGATTSNVDVYLNGSYLGTTANDGFASHRIYNAGTYSYVVCNAGSTTECSDPAEITWY